jgi:hypothetical protein
VATHSPRSSTGNNSRSAAVRGALLIGVAVILGAVLLAQSFNDGGSPVSAGGTTTSTVKRSESSTTPSTAPQPHDPAEIHGREHPAIR